MHEDKRYFRSFTAVITIVFQKQSTISHVHMVYFKSSIPDSYLNIDHVLYNITFFIDRVFVLYL